jgi:dTDP-4-dehydrorhamnose reductase
LLVHISNDYVIDGTKPTPYTETDIPNPLNAYGRSKLAGEEAIRASGCRHLIVRTSWVYAATGSNFLLTMLRLARAGKPLRVVDDQTGAPTSNAAIAAGVVSLLSREEIPEGTFHMTAAGRTTWYGFAHAIFDAMGIPAALTPIPTSDYPTPARRPANSTLDNKKLNALGVRLPDWRMGMLEIVQTLR